MILLAHERAVGLKVLISHLKVYEMNVDIVVANQVLAQVEEKLRPALEQKLGEKNREVKSKILEEALLTLKHSNQTDYSLSGININNVVKETDIIIDQHKDRGIER
jgi:hypothetical protein